MLFLQKLPHDKALHLIAGVIIFATFNFFFTWQIGLLMSFIIGAAKEVYDKMSGKGTPDPLDFVVTGLGGVLGLLCCVKYL